MIKEHPDYELLERLATADGEAAAETSQEHVSNCQGCQSWLDTYRLLTEALSNEKHPASAELAHYAVDSNRLDEAVREHLEQHIASCPECREQLDLAAKAVAGARDQDVIAMPARPAVLPARLALAASLLLLLGLAWTLRPTPNSNISVTETLMSESIRGSRLIEASGSITAESVTVEAGSDVTFRAGDLVVLNDGFSVGNGANFQIEIGSSTKPNQG